MTKVVLRAVQPLMCIQSQWLFFAFDYKLFFSNNTAYTRIQNCNL